MANQHDPLFELDAAERAAELHEKWVDVFIAMCALPPPGVETVPERLAYVRAHSALADALRAREDAAEAGL